MLSAITLSVIFYYYYAIMLNAIMLSVMAPFM
jgi:hypothetical protein